MELQKLLLKKLKDKFPDVEFEDKIHRGELTISFDKKYVVEICKFVKNDDQLKFDYCEDVTAVDWARRKNRFSMIYQLFSIDNKWRLRLKTTVDESDLTVDSVSSVWGAADWYEREVYDMFGIEFDNHPDHRRMYMPEEFEYHPLRKDFPLMGIPGSLPLPKK